MMPWAKIVNRRSWPPENRSTKPSRLPLFCSKNCCSLSAFTPGVGMCPPRRYTASRPSVNRMRLRRSGMRKTLASFSSIGYNTSNLPPALVIFSWADLENLWACTVSAIPSSPSPSTFNGCLLLITPALRNTSGVIVVSPSAASFSRFTMLNSWRKMLVNPRLGMRRCKGIWPPSKPRIMREPLRERWPLCPRAEVLPIPEPMPRPTRFLFSAAFFGARTLERFINKLSAVSSQFFLRTELRRKYLQQMRHLGHHAADGWVIRPLDDLVQPGKAQTFDY